ncbi:MAG: type II toxin-antitoxin system VapC family toxin [Paludibacteraceae bacterium]|nr:type II toxin-antitoxin system VapC family toxin [Paludibacteraceae bacterium]
MRYLLDTNIFVYLATDRDLLSKDVAAILSDYDSVLCMSAESVKELIVAFRNKKLFSKLWKKEQEMLTAIKDEFYIQILPVNMSHMETYADMTLNENEGHKDPSDHVIIAQAITERIPLISSDTRFPFYTKQGLQLIYNSK